MVTTEATATGVRTWSRGKQWELSLAVVLIIIAAIALAYATTAGLPWERETAQPFSLVGSGAAQREDGAWVGQAIVVLAPDTISAASVRAAYGPRYGTTMGLESLADDVLRVTVLSETREAANGALTVALTRLRQDLAGLRW